MTHRHIGQLDDCEVPEDVRTWRQVLSILGYVAFLLLGLANAYLLVWLLAQPLDGQLASDDLHSTPPIRLAAADAAARAGVDAMNRPLQRSAER